jgi:hypothetical protein
MRMAAPAVSRTSSRCGIQPQIAAELSFRDFVENRDPCVDAILEWIKAGTVK